MNKKIHIRTYNAMNLKDRFKQQFKMTKIEKIVTIALIIILVGYGVYQTAYGLTLTQVANEASYKYGFIQGKSEWGSCSDADGDCQTGLTDCHLLIACITTQPVIIMQFRIQHHYLITRLV
jgi:hypothetical protein